MSEHADQHVTQDEADEADAFNTMMTALDIFFHMAHCPNHTARERGEALVVASAAYEAFAGRDDEDDAEVVEVMSEADRKLSGAQAVEVMIGADCELLDAAADMPRGNAPTSHNVH